MGLGAAYLFCLGLACGLALLTLTAYRRVSPPWLKWLLIGLGLFVMSRYVTLALFTQAKAVQQFWALRHCWLATSVGITLPSVIAVDQLVRHPAMTPKRLLMWFAPFLIVYVAVIAAGHFTPMPDPVIGWALKLSPTWQSLLSIVQGIFVVAFVSGCLLLIRKLPSRPIRLALAGLIAAHLYLAVDGLLLALGGWYFRPFLFSEMLTLLALWHAFSIE